MDYDKFKKEIEEYENYINPRKLPDMWKEHKNDQVNSPAHYTSGKYEAIDVIEDAIDCAPDVQKGFLQAQVLKYILRLWHKGKSKEDARKAEWYLRRLIDSL